MHDNHGCVAADFSGDGRLDLFVPNGACNGNCLKWDRLWVQGVDGRFSEVGGTYLGPQTTDRSRDVVLLDADRDGWPDVFVNAAARAVLGSHHRLLRNLGSDGSGNWLGFSEAVAGVEQSGGEVSCAAAADFDADGWTDLAVCQRTGLFLFRNMGGTFQKHTAQLPGRDIRGVQFADFNGDGLLDLALAKVTGLEIRSNVGGGVFSTVLFSAPLATGWDVVAPDIDGDGDRDVFVTQVKLGQPAASTGAHSLWLNPLNGGGVWQRVLVPQPARGGGDKAEVFPNFRNSGRDALLVANGGGAAWGPAGPRQVLAVSGL